jgi:hypothetical protein
VKWFVGALLALRWTSADLDRVNAALSAARKGTNHA